MKLKVGQKIKAVRGKSSATLYRYYRTGEYLVIRRRDGHLGVKLLRDLGPRDRTTIKKCMKETGAKVRLQEIRIVLVRNCFIKEWDGFVGNFTYKKTNCAPCILNHLSNQKIAGQIRRRMRKQNKWTLTRKEKFLLNFVPEYK